jgi:hypothetical protein
LYICWKIIIFVKNYFKMRIILDIQDHKVAFIMELLQSFPYIKTQPEISNLASNSLTNNEIDIMKYVKPMRSFTLDDLVREQNYQGVNMEQINEIRASLNLKDEPLEELLECIK